MNTMLIRLYLSEQNHRVDTDVNNCDKESLYSTGKGLFLLE